MRKLLLFCVTLLFLSGCALVTPVAAKFPEAPELLMVDCEQLDKIGKDKVYLSEFLTTVVGNYNKYHVCSAQNAAWREWYKKQKEIYNKVGK